MRSTWYVDKLNCSIQFNSIRFSPSAARIGQKLELPDRAERWQATAKEIKDYFNAKCWNAELNSYVSIPETTEVQSITIF